MEEWLLSLTPTACGLLPPPPQPPPAFSAPRAPPLLLLLPRRPAASAGCYYAPLAPLQKITRMCSFVAHGFFGFLLRRDSGLNMFFFPAPSPSPGSPAPEDGSRAFTADVGARDTNAQARCTPQTMRWQAEIGARMHARPVAQLACSRLEEAAASA